MRNLLAETLEVLECEHLTPDDVQFVRTTTTSGTWAEFVALATGLEYDAGYGGIEVNVSLMIVGRDWWLERHEYDGSEWWEFKRLPTPEGASAPLGFIRESDDEGGY